MSGAFDSLFGGGGLGAAAGAGAAASAAPSADLSPAGDKEWYVAIDDAQVGPIDLREVEQRWDSNEINEDSLSWKAGMGDWVPIAEIPELAYLITERAHEAPAAAASPASLGGMAASSGGVSPSPAAVTPMSFSGGGSPAGDVSWKPSAASALSSLVQEELVVKPQAPAPAPASSSAGGLPSFGGGGGANLFSGGNGGVGSLPSAGSFAPSGGFAMPSARPAGGGGHKSMVIMLGIVAMMLIAAGVVVVFFVMKQPAPPAVAAVQPRAKPAVAPGDGRAAPRSAVARPSTGTRTPAPAPRGDTTRKPKTNKPKTGSSRGDKPDRPKRQSRDSLDDIFDDKPKSKGKAKPDKEKLSMQDILAGAKRNAGKLLPCLKTAKGRGELAPGKYKFILDWTIKPNGNVTGARLRGPSTVMGTSLPACFARNMKKWKFPSSRAGAPIKNFPFGPINVR